MASIHRVHREDETAGRRVLSGNFNQKASGNVGSNKFGGHATPAEARAEKRVLCTEIGEPPISR
jgi:hypothetical protein